MKPSQDTLSKSITDQLPGFHPGCFEFLTYWDGLGKEGLIPRRNQFRPEDIPRLLNDLILVELISDDEIKTRLAGASVIESFGFDPKGKNYLDYVAPERRQIASMNIWLTHKQPCGVWALTEQQYPEGKSVQSEMLGLPILGDANCGPLVLFLKHAVKRPKFLNRASYPFAINHIIDLKFLDIGAGVPALPQKAP